MGNVEMGEKENGKFLGMAKKENGKCWNGKC